MPEAASPRPTRLAGGPQPIELRAVGDHRRWQDRDRDRGDRGDAARLQRPRRRSRSAGDVPVGDRRPGAEPADTQQDAGRLRPAAAQPARDPGQRLPRLDAVGRAGVLPQHPEAVEERRPRSRRTQPAPVLVLGGHRQHDQRRYHRPVRGARRGPPRREAGDRPQDHRATHHRRRSRLTPCRATGVGHLGDHRTVHHSDGRRRRPHQLPARRGRRRSGPRLRVDQGRDRPRRARREGRVRLDTAARGRTVGPRLRPSLARLRHRAELAGGAAGARRAGGRQGQRRAPHRAGERDRFGVAGARTGCRRACVR